MLTNFWSENLSRRGHLKDPCVVGREMLKCILKKWSGEGVDWIHLAQDRDRWRVP
jgi:hypothetical protein